MEWYWGNLGHGSAYQILTSSTQIVSKLNNKPKPYATLSAFAVVTLVLFIFVQVRIELENKKMSLEFEDLKTIRFWMMTIKTIRFWMMTMICFGAIHICLLTMRMSTQDPILVGMRVHVLNTILTLSFLLIFLFRSPNLKTYLADKFCSSSS